MKKSIFVLFLCVLISVIPSIDARADIINNYDHGVRIVSQYEVELLTSGKYHYTFHLHLASLSPSEHGCSLSSYGVLWYGEETDDDFADDIRIGYLSEGSFKYITKEINGVENTVITEVTMEYTSDVLLYDPSGQEYFCMEVSYQSPLAGTVALQKKFVKFTLSGDLPDSSSPTPSATPTQKPTATPTPKPTSTPTPRPTSTPKPTPTPKPTSTPKPTPTNTPTPTPSPTPAPTLQLKAYVDNNTAVAEYYTGGCTPVKSMIEYYEVGTGTLLSKLNSETFLSGAGTMENFMEPGKVYRYKLTYIYQHDGIQYEKFLWSDDLSIKDQELEDYRESGKITNFRTLMLYTWENIMDIDIPVEGFELKARDLFIWIMVASLAIFFWRRWNGG